jgi:hypothetical protein
VNSRILALAALCLLSSTARADASFDFEDQQIPPGWSQGSGTQASWIITDAVASAGSHSLRSGPIADGQLASIVWSGTFDESMLSFDLRVQSESCCDHFQLLIDGTVVHTLSGNASAWTQVRESLSAGPHTIQWTYRKDGSHAVGADAAWIDNVRVGAPLPVVDPLLQHPGAVVVSAEGRIAEARMDSPTLTVHEATFAGALGFAPNGALYIADRQRNQVLRYQPVSSTFQPVASNIGLSAIAVLSDRVIGGRIGSCGAYSTVFLASGNVFNGSQPGSCADEWRTIVRQGNDLFVLQYDRITRRATAAPGTISASLALAHGASDLARAADGSYWTVAGNVLRHLGNDGAVLETHLLDRYVEHVALREDGLLAVAGYDGTGFVRPDHGFQSWRAGSGYAHDIAFVAGIVVDQDGDTLPLWFEQAYGFDPSSNADAALDSDGDTLTNAQEYVFKSNPRLADSDADGASDAQEQVAGSNPRHPDTDGDGLTDGVEIVDLGSNPLAVDSDSDGMGDYYEFTHGLNVVLNDALADPDGDGLGNLDEFQRGTNPAAADSDADGLGDGAEVQTHGTDPLDSDTDGDGLTDGAEVNSHGTLPLLVDTDADGLGDFLEAVTLGSNPLSGDSDGDGMPDGWEHAHALNLVANDAAGDADLDGLANGAEFLAGTDPTNADSDHDELGDNDEIGLGTDPTRPDSDGDRVPDGWEFAFAHDPLVPDAARDDDRDSFTALEEFWSGSAENDAASHPRPQSWSTHQGNARHNGFQPMSLRQPLGTSPTLQVAIAGLTQPVVAGNGRIFYTRSRYEAPGNILVAIDATTGLESWRKSFGNVFSTSPPAYAEGRVYVQTGNHSGDTFLHAYDAVSGELVFKSPHSAQWEQYLAPTVFDGHVYINGGYYGGAYAFDRVTGAQQWFAGLAQWDEWTPAVDADHVYAYTGGSLDVLDRATGTVQFTMLDPRFGWNGYTVGMAPVLGGYDNVIVCQAGHMTSFDVKARAVAWTRDNCPLLQPAAANAIVFSIDGNALYAIDELDGSTAWTQTFATTLRDNVVVTREFAIVSDQTHTHFVRMSDRAIVRSLPATGNKTLTDDGRLIIVGDQQISVYRLGVLDPAQVVFANSFE